MRQKVPPSYCCACDERECEHTGPRYHNSWLELRVNGSLAPEYEAWFEANPHGHEEREAPKARPLESLEGDLERWMFLDPELRSLLSSRYEERDRKTSFLVQDILRACEQGRLMRPAATLASRLKSFR